MDEFSPQRLAASLERMPPVRAYRIAFSGGADSTALLHAFCALRGQLAPTPVAAVHVHHALQAQADAWEHACRRLCADLGVSLEVVQVDARAGRGESPEAAARRARYGALSELLGEGEAICMAHHQRDQAETLLLQLMRGAGPAGLAGMPALTRIGRGWLARPLLDVHPDALRAYLARHGVSWSEDPSNRDRSFDRNYLRHEILPRLERRWPGAPRTLARAAGHQADNVELGRTLAELDLAAARGPLPGTLSAAALAAMPPARARNLVRRWLSERGLPMAAAVHLQGILDELLTARDDATPLVSWPGAEVRRYRQLLYASKPLPAHDPSRVLPWVPGGALALEHGELRAISTEGRGLSAERCATASLEVRFRQGGERFQPSGHAHGSALKKLLQQSAVPPWLRDRIPLIYVDGELAAVTGLWVASGFAVNDGRRGWLLSWTELPGQGA